ncbi:hypothetical protein LTR17_001115 [Elasticomyces elasticus]|nr:hypothetical protein LTR17_001115 [Elasticomyces elasticus]
MAYMQRCLAQLPQITTLSSLSKFTHAHHRVTINSKTQAAMEGSRLLDLPPELRNRIYELVFSTGGTIVVRQHHNGSDIRAFTSIGDGVEALAERHSLALLRTCKQVNQEAALMFWACNEFHVMAGYTCSWAEEHRSLSPLHAFLDKAQRRGATVFGKIVFYLGRLTLADIWTVASREVIVEAFRQLRAWEIERPELHFKVEFDLVIRLYYSSGAVDRGTQTISFDGLRSSATTLQAAIAELNSRANKIYEGNRPRDGDFPCSMSLLQDLHRDYRRSLGAGDRDVVEDSSKRVLSR